MVDVLGNPIRVFLRYAVPAVFGMLAISSASIIDGFFIGNYVGLKALAAVNICIPVFPVTIGYGMMLAVGGSVMAGKYLGEKNTLAASAIFTRTLLVLILSAIFVSAIALLNLDALLMLLGADASLLPLSAQYMEMIFWFVPVAMTTILLIYFVRVSGYPGLAALAMLLASAINILLDFLFIAKYGWGLRGAAIATGISYLLPLFMLAWPIMTGRGPIGLGLQHGSWHDIKLAMFNGLSDFVNEASVGIKVLIFNWVMMLRMGVDGVGAYAIVAYIYHAGVVAFVGVADAIQPLASYLLGTREPDRIRVFMRIGFSSVLMLGAVIALCVVVFPYHIVAVFLDDPSGPLGQIVYDFLRFFSPVFLFSGTSICVVAYLTAMHRPIPSAILALLRSFLLPVVLITTLPPLLGNQGVFLALPIAEFFTVLVAVIIYHMNSPAVLIKGARRVHESYARP